MATRRYSPARGSRHTGDDTARSAARRLYHGRNCLTILLALVLAVGCGDDGGGGDGSSGAGGGGDGGSEAGTGDRQQREEKVLADANGLETLLDSFWTNELSRLYGITFDPPDRFEYYRGTGNNPCGPKGQPIPNNAYYCPVDADEYVAFDIDWFQNYLIEHPGGATTFLILAHEWGHAVQDSWLESGGPDQWEPAYRKELNADCLAGVFITRQIQDGSIEEEAGDAGTIWRWLYESGGGAWFDPSDHGTSAQRQVAFADGIEKGTDACRTEY